MPSATVGDPILVLNRRWFDLMLQGVKTLEIRHHRLSPGKRLVGEKGVIWGCVVLGKDPFQVMSDSQWNDLRPRHRWDSTQTTLPFKKTWAMVVTDLQEFTSTLRSRVRWRWRIGLNLCCNLFRRKDEKDKMEKKDKKDPNDDKLGVDEFAAKYSGR